MMNKDTYRKKLKDCLNSIPFGNRYESVGLTTLGNLLAVPEKALHNYLYYEAIRNGDIKTVKRLEDTKRFDHWERYAGYIAAVMACAWIYKNPKRFLWNSQKQNLPQILLQELTKHKVFINGTSDVDAFVEYARILAKTTVSDGYRMYFDNMERTIKKDILYRACAEDLEIPYKTLNTLTEERPVHPFIVHTLTEILYPDRFLGYNTNRGPKQWKYIVSEIPISPERGKKETENILDELYEGLTVSVNLLSK